MKVHVCQGCGKVCDPQNLDGSWRFNTVPGLIEHVHAGIRHGCEEAEVVSAESIIEAIQPGGTIGAVGAVEAARWASNRIGVLSERLSETVERESALKARVRDLEEAPCLSETERETALRKRVRRLEEALRLTQEYVGDKMLPPSPGWSWFDALSESQNPAMHPRSAAHLAADLTGALYGKHGEYVEDEPERAVIEARHVPYLPTHNHTKQEPCWISCPVFDFEDYKNSYGDPFQALAARTAERDAARAALADIRAAAHGALAERPA